MVNPEGQIRDYPAWSLDRVRELAKAGKVIFAGSRAENDAQNLGYGPEEVNACIACLEESQFTRSIRYGDRDVWLDEYHTHFRAPTGELDELYVKLRLSEKLLTVSLHSIHRHR